MKNLIKLLGIIALIAIIGLGVTACKEGDDPPKVIAEHYRGSGVGIHYLDISATDYDNQIEITVGETSISYTGDKTGSLTGLHTVEGGVTKYTGKWAYLYKDGIKIGIITEFEGAAVYVGKSVTLNSNKSYIEEDFEITFDVTGVSDYPSIGYF